MKQREIAVLIIGIAVILVGMSFLSKFFSKNSTTNNPKASQNTFEQLAASPSDGQLKVEDLTIGTGAEATPGAQVTVHYTGTLTNGTKFDSSYDHGQPFSFALGAGQVIQGWDQGVAGMKVGGKRRLTIPPSLGYGSQGAGSIPPNSTLIFEIELLDVK